MGMGDLATMVASASTRFQALHSRTPLDGEKAGEAVDGEKVVLPDAALAALQALSPKTKSSASLELAFVKAPHKGDFAPRGYEYDRATGQQKEARRLRRGTSDDAKLVARVLGMIQKQFKANVPFLDEAVSMFGLPASAASQWAVIRDLISNTVWGGLSRDRDILSPTSNIDDAEKPFVHPFTFAQILALMDKKLGSALESNKAISLRRLALRRTLKAFEEYGVTSQDEYDDLVSEFTENASAKRGTSQGTRRTFGSRNAPPIDHGF